MQNNNPCPCGLEKTYSQCCSRFIDKSELPSNPEELMRSRYTAFCTKNIAYIKETWHPETLPEDLSDNEPNHWISLDIIESSTEEDGLEGEVEFEAKLIDEDRLEVLHEVSQFEKVDGKWLYHSGDFIEDKSSISKISKNKDCPCGSEKKFKRCHFKA